MTHEPIGRALVYSAGQRFAAFTDDHGHFELTLQAVENSNVRTQTNSRVFLQARKPGFLGDPTQQRSTVVVPGQKDVTMSLVPEALIVGHVKFPSAEAADHVQVQLCRREVRDGFAQWTPLTNVTTRSDGEFRFADLPAGEYKLFTLETTEQDPLASIPNGPVFGFPPRFFAAARDFATADTIRVRAGETFTANIAPERQRYYDVRVPVMVPEPADSGLGVSVYAQGHRGPGFALGYDQRQHAIIGSLPNGSFTIEADSFGPAAATGITNITVSNGPVNGPRLILAQNASIEVNIREDMTGADNQRVPRSRGAPNRPLAYVRLQPAEEYSGQRGPGMTYQSQGDFPTLSGVEPGRYWVQVQEATSPSYASSVTSGDIDLLRALLVVPFGASVPPIEITLRYDTGEIEATIEGEASGAAMGRNSGTVNTGAGPIVFQPLPGLSVYCIPAGNDGSPAITSHAWSNGRYILQVPPGDYRVLAFDTPHELEYRNPAAMRAYESKGQVVHVTAGQKAQVTLQPITSE